MPVPKIPNASIIYPVQCLRYTWAFSICFTIYPSLVLLYSLLYPMHVSAWCASSPASCRAFRRYRRAALVALRLSTLVSGFMFFTNDRPLYTLNLLYSICVRNCHPLSFCVHFTLPLAAHGSN